MRAFGWVVLLVLLCGCRLQAPTLPAPRPSTAVVRAASPGPVAGTPPRPSNLPYAMPVPWTDADARAIHERAVPALPSGVAPAGTHLSPMIPRLDEPPDCPRYAVALATNDATSAVAALERILAAAYEKDERGELVWLMMRGRALSGRGVQFDLAMWAADRSHGAIIEHGASRDLAAPWMGPVPQRELILVTYVQRCALR